MFGIGNGNGCTSTLTTYAIGIGDGAVANAPTLFGGALAIGKNANASTVTIGTSAFNFATAIGDNANASGYISLFGLALQLGEGTAGTFGVGNIAIGVGEGLGNQAAVSGVAAPPTPVAAEKNTRTNGNSSRSVSDNSSPKRALRVPRWLTPQAKEAAAVTAAGGAGASPFSSPSSRRSSRPGSAHTLPEKPSPAYLRHCSAAGE
jgi:hypothetical protein